MLFLLCEELWGGGGARDFRAPPPRFLMPKRPPQFAAGASALNFITAHRGQWLIFSCRRDGVRGAFFTGRAFTPSVLLPTFAGQQDSSPKEAPTIRNFTNQESICSPLKPTQKNTSSFFGDPGRQGGKNACFDAVGKGIGLTPSVTAPKRASDAVPPPRRGG